MSDHAYNHEALAAHLSHLKADVSAALIAAERVRSLADDMEREADDNIRRLDAFVSAAVNQWPEHADEIRREADR